MAVSRDQLTAGLDRASRPARRIWPRLSEALLGIAALLIVAFCLLTYSTTAARAASELVSGNRYLVALDGLLNPFRTRHLLVESGLPVYDLKIDFREFTELENVAREARRRGILSEDLKRWVRADFFYGDRRYDVKIRIRGDLPAHWEGPKKSWAIKFGSDTVLDAGRQIEVPDWFQGRRRINLIIPVDREYTVAPFVNELAREAKMMAPRDRYVVLRINGSVQGLYYEVEDLDKPLTVAYKRPESPVQGQNGLARHFDQYTKLGAATASDAKFDLVAMRRDATQADELALRALQVLVDHSLKPTAESFRRVRLVLDWDKYLAFKSLTTLMNTNHVRFGSDNMKLFFDPSKGLLEPVPWDLHLVKMPREPATVDFWNDHGPDELERATLEDPQARLERNLALWKLVADEGDRILSIYERLHERIRPIAWADVLSTPIHGAKMDRLRKILRYNVARTHHVLAASTGTMVYRLEAPDRVALDVSSTNFSGIELRGLRLADTRTFRGDYRLYRDDGDGGFGRGDGLVASGGAVRGELELRFREQVLPRVRYDGGTIGARYWEYYDTLSGRARFFLVGRVGPERHHPLEWRVPKTIEVTAVNAVSGARLQPAVVGRVETLPANALAITALDGSRVFDLDAELLSRAGFLRANPQFQASRTQPDAVELRGRVRIDRTTIVPRGVPLVVAPGADVTLARDVSVVAYGGLTSIGRPDAWIRIHGEGGRAWGVLGALRPEREVVVRYTHIRDGGQAEVNGTLFTGGLAVHNGDLTLEHVRITDMASEDGANLKNGRLVMRDTEIARTASDAFDLDFGTGTIAGNRFHDIAGDGFDMSGSRVTIIGNRFERIGDKGLSIGEDTHPIVLDNLFYRCNIGISNKDLSHGRVAFSTFVENATAIEAKLKKDWYGPGSGEYANNVFFGNKTLLSEDYSSRGNLDLHHSLVDDPKARCRACVVGRALFRAAGRSDFHLSDASPAGRVALLPWASALPGGVPELPGLLEPVKAS